MAHFAKLDENNVVLEVHVVNNAVLDPSNEESSGITFLTEWSSGYTNWKQTSYNRNFRKYFAGIGFTYDETRDAFISPKPVVEGKEFALDEDTCQWKEVPEPTV
jgi:hypothetical protein